MYHSTTLASVQLQMEAFDAEEGAARYLERQAHKTKREGFDRRDDVQKMIRGAVPIVSAGIAKWTERASQKKGRPSAALGALQELDPDVVALGAVSATFREIAMDKPLTAVARQIGCGIRVEIEALMLQAEDPKAAKRFLALAEGEASPKANLKRHEALMERLGLGLQWSNRTEVLVGGTVLNIILTVLRDVFVRDMRTDKRGTIPIVKLTEEAMEQLQLMQDAAAWMHPILRPMMTEPRKWTHIDTGAYLDYKCSKFVPMVRTFNRDHQKLIREAIKDGSMQEELDALNTIQETRFAIDKRVLEVMLWAKEEGRRPSESFPLSEAPEKPAKMPKEEWEALPQATRTALSRKRTSIMNIRGATTVNASVFKVDMAEAKRLGDLPCFYLPHSLDFRGRVYAVPHFNPQRSDHIKALFRFADTCPMGPDGGYWLSVHLANCGDFNKVSKASFGDRVAWVKRHEHHILKIASDPCRYFKLWAKADSPFCFLQACFEYAEWVASGYSEAFEGCISVALDGSCSGLQHYSAMTRSAEEGYHVNLLSRETPGDIYKVVATQALPGLEALAAGGDLACTTILKNGFGRSQVKRNVMTYFYGSGKFGMRDQHMDDLMRPLADEVALGKREAHPYALLTERKDKETGEVTHQLDGGFTCAQVLAAHVHHAVVSVAPKADEAATWFQNVAALLAHESLPVIWRTPTGLPVMQKYSEYTSKAVNIWLYDRKVMVPEMAPTDKLDEEGNVLSRIRCLLREAPTKRIDKKKARSAISPNIVHSLDGSHLKRTVVFAKAEGIIAFQLIHDSFATHAGNTGKFFRIIREAFVNLYETYCPFEAIDTYARSVLSEESIEKLPAIPARGTLDLSAILTSDYAFA